MDMDVLVKPQELRDDSAAVTRQGSQVGMSISMAPSGGF
jgi:hypothetical protein